MVRQSVAVGLAALIAVGLLVARDPPAARAGDLPAPPLIEVVPGCTGGVFEGTYDGTFRFKFRNFPPNAALTVNIRTGDPPQVQNVTVGAYGALDQDLTFTIVSTNPIPVDAFDTANPAIAASTTIRVPCEERIVLTPRCDAPADPVAPRPLSITVEAFEWSAEPVRFQLMLRAGGVEQPISNPVEGRSTPEQPNFSVVINAAFSGSDDVSSPLMAQPAGDYFVRAFQRATEVIPETTLDADFAVPCPEVSVAPNCGPPGGPPDLYDIAVSGSGFRPFVQAQVIFDAFSQPQVFLLDVGATGQLLISDVEEARIKPFRRPELPGAPYAVMVLQKRGDDVSREATAAFIVPCPPQPTVTIDPLCGPPQIEGDDPAKTTSLRLVGSNLEAGDLLILVTPEGGTVPTTQSTLPHTGSFDARLDLIRLPTGTYRIDVSQQFVRAAPFLASFTFRVPCSATDARVRLRCNEDPANPDLAELVINASRFYEDAPLQLALNGVVETVRTDAEGQFTRRLPIAGLQPGVFEVSAIQRDTNAVVVAEGTDQLVVPCRTGTPILTISPSAGAPGLVVTIEGFNLRPNATLGMRWSQGIGSSRPIVVTADADGVFERQVLLFHHDFTGTRELTVETSSDPRAVGMTLPFVVGAGSGTPPTLVDTSPGFPPIVIRH